MRIYDITIPISQELQVWPGDPPVEIAPVASISRGDCANVSRLTISSHAGTHIDAPRHYSDHGVSVDHIPPSLLVGEAQLLDLTGVRRIGRHELSRLPVKGHERVLLKTDNSLLWDKTGFCEDYAALTADGAAYLLEAGVKLVGIDYLSVEPFDGSGEIHGALLSGGVVILEGLNLEGAPAGSYELICLPLRIKGGDGAPARAILRGGGHVEERPELDPHTTKWPLA